MVGVTNICKDVLSKKEVNISMIKTCLSIQSQDLIKTLSDLHSINPILNGCVMEAILALVYAHDLPSMTDKIIDKYFDICCKILCKKTSSSFESFYVNLFKSAITNPSVNVLDLYNETFPARYIIFYITVYLLTNNYDCEEWLKIDDFSKYMTELVDNAKLIFDYINSIKQNIDIKSEFCVWCDFKSIGLNDLKGKCDMVSDEWLIDIKCSNSYDYKEWFKQLEVYNLAMRKKNIAIINILTNEFIIYNNLGQISISDLMPN